ncbi:MAG: hypothetical protein K2H72_04985 [Muribaculaceae bacterium]|nr:hypothetical protein [Muribaculaceae bacterium]
MRYDEDTYHNEDDLWDDELDLNSDGYTHGDADGQRFRDASDSTYSTYHTGDGYDRYGDNNDDIDNKNSASPESEEHDYYSDPEPEPETPGRSRLRALFKRKDDEDEEETEVEEDEESEDTEEENDFYDSPAPPKRPKTPKAPKLDPEDPDYWIEEEDSPLSGIMTGGSKKWKWILAGSVAFLVLIIFAWIWFLRPYTDNAVKYGYISNMERRGLLIKTFEGTMIPYKELGDPDPLYFKEVHFSVESDSLAAQMKRMMLGCAPVRVEYELYHSPLPWKGETSMIIMKADTADPRKILPPEYRHSN